VLMRKYGDCGCGADRVGLDVTYDGARLSR
jgi:hypothetical protein